MESEQLPLPGWLDILQVAEDAVNVPWEGEFPYHPGVHYYLSR